MRVRAGLCYTSVVPNKRNWLPWLALAIVYVALVTISWKRWANPIVDCGREMYVPWRIAEGDVLYRDLFWMYGPLVPYWHALLFRLCGPHLNVLYVVGLLLVAVQTRLLFVLAARVLDRPFAALAAVLFLVQFAIRPSLGNLVFPYSFNAAYASTFNLLALWAALKHRESGRGIWLWVASSAVGLSLLNKQEIGLAGFLFLAGYAAVTLTGSRFRLIALLPSIALPVIGYGIFAILVGPIALLHDSLWPRAVLAQMETFHKYVVGSLFEPRAVLYLLGLGAIALGGMLAVASLAYPLDRKFPRAGSIAAVVAVAVLLIITPFSGRFFRFVELNHVHAASCFLLLAGLVTVFRRTDARSSVLDPRFLILAFALLSTWRAPLFAFASAYSAIFMPASVIAFVWFWTKCLPHWRPSLDPVHWQRCVMTIVVTLCVIQAGRSLTLFRTKFTHRIESDRGDMVVHKDIGPILAELMNHLKHRTKPGEAVLFFPEETSLYFLCDLRSPSKYYQFAPGLLPSARQQGVLIESATNAGVKLVTVSNRATTEYGVGYFGLHYYQPLREWILANFELRRSIGTATRAVPLPPPSRYWPEDGYGIDVYERK